MAAVLESDEGYDPALALEEAERIAAGDTLMLPARRHLVALFNECQRLRLRCDMDRAYVKAQRELYHQPLRTEHHQV